MRNCCKARVLWIGTLLLGALSFLSPTRDAEAVDWLLFAGGFHPLAVHLPIGLWAGTVLVVIAGIRRPAMLFEPWLKGGALVTWLSACISFLTGLTLYFSGTYSDMVKPHLIAAWVFLVALNIFYDVVMKGAGMKKVGLVAIVVSLVMGYAGHLGGVMTHGDIFADVPWQAQAAEASAEQAVNQQVEHLFAGDDRSVFEAAVYPILDDKCLLCHAGRRLRAKLSMETEEAILKGGVTGAAMVAGDADESMMIQRMRLPEDDELHMPPMEPFVTAEEERLLVWWINEGIGQQLSALPAEFASFVKPPEE